MHPKYYPFGIMKLQQGLLTAFFTFIILFGISCSNPNTPNTTIDFKDSLDSGKLLKHEKNSPIYIAIASMTSPKETFVYYSQLIDYLSQKLGRTILIKQKKTYKEVNDLLRKGQVDFAFICSGAFAELAIENEVDLLVAPVINGKTYYQAYIITQKDPNINSFEGLKDKTFGFTDPLSNTGFLYPQKLVKELNATSRDFFSKTMYTYGHDISIQMVNRGAIDGASVHGLIYDYIAEQNPQNVVNTKVLKRSDWFAMPPVVTPKNLNKATYNTYKDLFLSLHQDSIGMEIMNKLKIEKFETVELSIFDNLRKLKTYVES